MGSEPGAGRAFWTGLPGVLTGLAALLTAAVGAVALLGGDGGDGSSGSAPAPAAAVRDPQPEPAPAPVAPATTAGTAETGPPAAGGRHLLLEDDYLDLETGLVGSGVTGDLQWQSSYLWVTAPARALVPTGADVAGCPAALAGRLDEVAVEPELVRRGVLVCLRTDAGTVALVRAGPPDGLGQLPVEVTPLR